MVDVNMLKMDYPEFIKSTQLIKEKPIISSTQGACFIFNKSSMSSMNLKDVWKHKGKSIENCSETYQDESVGSLIEKDVVKRLIEREVLMRRHKLKVVVLQKKRRIILCFRK
ncbi:hypothetical protein H5410_015696 [Solanum commersonii]|uniref:Uncharacterized protein n=1 Tax=Solanum commersonii TaxID=4109 RepID=A0A9J5ZUJ8_SOLCO|nr:hypothetical protein H5410_015696 [Solanum commersonii]